MYVINSHLPILHITVHPSANPHQCEISLVRVPSTWVYSDGTYLIRMATNPVPNCCGVPMTRFTAQTTGRPYVKCHSCEALHGERDTRIPDCHCGLTAKLCTAKTPSNYGRKFRGCGKAVSDPTKCNFFAWAWISSKEVWKVRWLSLVMILTVLSLLPHTYYLEISHVLLGQDLLRDCKFHLYFCDHFIWFESESELTHCNMDLMQEQQLPRGNLLKLILITRSLGKHLCVNLAVANTFKHLIVLQEAGCYLTMGYPGWLGILFCRCENRDKW